jgi:hypothetical protein
MIHACAHNGRLRMRLTSGTNKFPQAKSFSCVTVIVSSLPTTVRLGCIVCSNEERSTHAH